VKLFLSSYHLGNHGGELVRLAGPGASALVVNNALDFLPEDARSHIRDGIVELETLGVQARELDLRHYVGHADALYRELSGSHLVWVRGGNSFILRRAMLASGFDAAARPLIESEWLVYGGYSAGAVVAPVGVWWKRRRPRRAVTSGPGPGWTMDPPMLRYQPWSHRQMTLRLRRR